MEITILVGVIVAIFCFFMFLANLEKKSSLAVTPSGSERIALDEDHQIREQIIADIEKEQELEAKKGFKAPNFPRTVILIGLVIIVIMTLYPPWNWHIYNVEMQNYGTFDQHQQQVKYYYGTSAGYHWLFSPPEGITRSSDYFSSSKYKRTHTPAIDWARLLLQYLAVVVASAGGYYFFRMRPQSSEPPGTPGA